MTTFHVPKNRAYSTLTAAVTAVATSWTVADGTKFPSTFPFNVTCELEIAECTNRVGNVLTVTREQEGTTKTTHALGAIVSLNVTAKYITELQDAINALEVVTASMLDDGTISLTASKAGWGQIQIGDMDEFAQFTFKADGTVNLLVYSTNITSVADTDNKFNIYKGSGCVVLQNKLGSTKKVAYKVEYYTPS